MKSGMPPWAKALIGAALYIPVLMLVSVPVGMLGDLVASRLQSIPAAADTVSVLGNLTGILVGTYLVVRFWDRRSFRDLGMTFSTTLARPLALALVAGAALAALAAGLQFALKVALLQHVGFAGRSGVFSEFYPSGGFWLPFAMVMIGLAVGAVTEEVMLRGYLLQALERGFGTVAAVVVTSAVFGVFHIVGDLKDGAPTVGMLVFASNVALLGGLFALAYVATRSLWVPIALHFAWNYAQGPVLGFAISGAHQRPELLQVAGRGPDLLTGGTWGLEGSVLTTAIVAVAVAAATWMSRRGAQAASGPDDSSDGVQPRHRAVAAR